MDPGPLAKGRLASSRRRLTSGFGPRHSEVALRPGQHFLDLVAGHDPGGGDRGLQPDLRMLHAGRPTTRGEKWIITQFVRSRAMR